METLGDINKPGRRNFSYFRNRPRGL